MLYICIEDGRLVAGAQELPENIAALGEDGWRKRGWLPCVDVDERVDGENYLDPVYEWDDKQGTRTFRSAPEAVLEVSALRSGVMTRNDSRQMLVDAGFTDAQATALITLTGGVA